MKDYLLPVTKEETPIKFAEEQLKIFWLPDEIKVEKDIQDILTNFSEAERHAAITTLKLFSLYETHAGDEYWGGRYKRIFNGAEFHRMASVFAMFELAVHAPFYNKINELLNLDKPEFYLEYQQTPVLRDRIEHVNEIIDDENSLVSIAGFSMVEGVILYSSFAFLKHYQSQGKNKLMNVVRGINFSVRDENLHAEAGAWSYRYLLEQRKPTEQEQNEIEDKIYHCAEKLYEHEKEIARLTFEKGKIDGITEKQVVHFVESRVNHCLNKLGLKKMFDVKYDPVSEWFYKGINTFQFNDFFAGQGREYHRAWDETAFIW